MSDMSSVWDFLDSVETGETEPHPFDKTKTVALVTAKTPENYEIIRKIGEELGVPVDIYDCIYEVAIRLRDK